MRCSISVLKTKQSDHRSAFAREASEQQLQLKKQIDALRERNVDLTKNLENAQRKAAAGEQDQSLKTTIL